MAHFPLLYSPCCIPLLLTWLPPAVTGIVHLNPRLLVNWLPLSPIGPLYPSLWNPDPPWVFPRLNVHSIRAISQTQFPVYDTIPSQPYEIAKNGDFAHVLAYKSPKTPFFALKYLTRYTHETFFEKYTNFQGQYLSHCRDIPLQSFGSHIRPQPHGLGLNLRQIY